ncbi:hypothetical protein HDV02_000711 [Globomyces sp. JEL0801]|nr:hypothetical protein HDV02_000711 [Globomyces sp. JEL0801]
MQALLYVTLLAYSAQCAVPKVGSFTTRYWDCCKPSCSWEGKAKTGQVVRSCKADGFQTINPSNTNVCIPSNPNGSTSRESGSYMCNDQQPFVDSNNPNLAYGFAAANSGLVPGGERESCCSCYKLQFNDPKLSGKTMIVQITNTGGDLAGQQFDLALPGGGVGYFRGACKTQWGVQDQNGQSGWGDTYGGVKSRNQCEQLPNEIRRGCYFRFDWFNNADNPGISYSKVTCPTQLTSITGCTNN